MGFARRHAADAPAFLLRGIALQYAKARQFGTDSERPCVGLESGAAKIAQGFGNDVGIPHRSFDQHIDAALHGVGNRHLDRSEEHTSELQSLMRISYAVFCLNKQKTAPRNTQKK